MSDLFPHHRSGLHDYRDLKATTAITPGMLVNDLTHGTLTTSTLSGYAVFVADLRTGYADYTAYASGDSGQMRRLGSGDSFRGILKSGESVTVGVNLAVDAGKLVEWVDFDTNGHSPIRALETVNAASGDARILAEVV